MHFLLADDSPQIRQLFGFWFQQTEHTTHIVKNGAEAVAAVEQEAFDAIVLDLEMPVMDGRQALRRIRQLPNGQSVPVVLISGEYTAPEMKPAMFDGADVGFEKPLDPTHILTTLEELVKRNRKKQAQ